MSEPKEVSLSRGKYVAFVDAEDFDFVNQYRWRLRKTKWTNYAIVSTEGVRWNFMHNLIMGYAPIDHIDHNGLNNQRSNLRDGLGNALNRLPNYNGGQYKGANWHKGVGKWIAGIRFKGKRIHLGYFDNEVDAAVAYDIKAVELFGEYALLNFPGEGAGYDE